MPSTDVNKVNLKWGAVLAVGAALLWGVSGNFAQFLFQSRGVNAEWLVTIRLLVSGFLLLLFAVVKNNARTNDGIWRIWLVWQDALALIFFGFGVLGVQYTYFAAIKNSNAATATVLQYLGPVVITGYYAYVEWRLPKKTEALAIALALAGTYLLVTHGHFDTLAISREGLLWGLASAVTLAIYNIQPIQLLKRYDSAVVIGWGMLIGGFVLSFVHAPWNISGTWDRAAFISVGFIVLLGTLVAFYAYLTAVKFIGATKASVLACAEPLSAASVSVLWMGVSFGFPEWVGTFLILSTIWVLTASHKSPEGPLLEI